MEKKSYTFIDELIENKTWKVGVVFSKTDTQPEFFIDTTCYLEKSKEKNMPELSLLGNFFEEYNGLTLFEYKTKHKHDALIKFVTNKSFHQINKKYKKNGEWNKFFQIGKSKELYSDEKNWFVLAEINNGPSCITTFVSGEYSGMIFFFEPQPHFNIAKPIAKNMDDFIMKLSDDTIKQINKFNSYFTITKSDGQNYGYRMYNIIKQ